MMDMEQRTPHHVEIPAEDDAAAHEPQPVAEEIENMAVAKVPAPPHRRLSRKQDTLTKSLHRLPSAASAFLTDPTEKEIEETETLSTGIKHQLLGPWTTDNLGLAKLFGEEVDSLISCAFEIATTLARLLGMLCVLCISMSFLMKSTVEGSGFAAIAKGHASVPMPSCETWRAETSCSIETFADLIYLSGNSSTYQYVANDTIVADPSQYATIVRRSGETLLGERLPHHRQTLHHLVSQIAATMAVFGAIITTQWRKCRRRSVVCFLLLNFAFLIYGIWDWVQNYEIAFTATAARSLGAIALGCVCFTVLEFFCIRQEDRMWASSRDIRLFALAITVVVAASGSTSFLFMALHTRGAMRELGISPLALVTIQSAITALANALVQEIHVRLPHVPYE